MGLFSKRDKQDSSRSNSPLSILSDNEIQSIVSFYQNGWPQEVRRQSGIPESAMDVITDKSILKGLPRRWLTKEEVGSIVTILEADMRLHGDDPNEKEIVRKLKVCKVEMEM